MRAFAHQAIIDCLPRHHRRHALAEHFRGAWLSGAANPLNSHSQPGARSRDMSTASRSAAVAMVAYGLYLFAVMTMYSAFCGGGPCLLVPARFAWLRGAFPLPAPVMRRSSSCACKHTTSASGGQATPPALACALSQLKSGVPAPGGEGDLPGHPPGAPVCRHHWLSPHPHTYYARFMLLAWAP